MITRTLLTAVVAVVAAAASAAAIADAGGAHVLPTACGIETPAYDRLEVWCNSPQAALTLDNGSRSSFAAVNATWHNMLAGAFVSTPEGVVIGTSREATPLKTSLSVQPHERETWGIHPNVGDSYRFAVLGDTRNPQTGATTFGKLGHSMADGQVAFAVHLGNAVTGGNAGQLKLFREQLRSFAFPTYVLPGNQDVTAGGRKAWRSLFGEMPVTFKLGHDRFIMADNAFGRLDKSELAWMERMLHQADVEHARHIFVFLHQPLVDIRPDLNQGMQDMTQVRELLRAFQAHRVHTVFAGHIPLYARETRRGVYYVTTGGGGEKLAQHAGSGAFYHYVRVEVNGDNVTTQAIALPTK